MGRLQHAWFMWPALAWRQPLCAHGPHWLRLVISLIANSPNKLNDGLGFTAQPAGRGGSRHAPDAPVGPFLGSSGDRNPAAIRIAAGGPAGDLWLVIDIHGVSVLPAGHCIPLIGRPGNDRPTAA